MRGAQAGRGEGGLHQCQRELGCEARRLVLLLRRPQLRQPFQLLQVRCNKRRLCFRGGAVLGFQMQWRLVVGLEIRRLDLHQIRLQRAQLCQQDGMFPMQCTEGLQFRILSGGVHQREWRLDRVLLYHSRVVALTYEMEEGV